ncbi:MAG TPA: GNAT family N-acetyltransferase [Longimicrobium sp.]|nr:GNAT family N-acetyltransferase [Longimicrobium sp.]
MEFREADENDAPFLADINRQLIEDEWDGGGMSLERLERRMRRWITEGDYRAILFQEGGQTVAYSLVSVDEDGESAYIRHFFVLHAKRAGGVGRRAIELLFREIIPPTARVTLDVLASNHGGHRFWRSVGFSDYAIRMERHPAATAADPSSPASDPPPDAVRLAP